MATHAVRSKRRISIELPGVIIEKLDQLASHIKTARLASMIKDIYPSVPIVID